MFKQGYEIASKFTQPLIVAYRFFNNSVESGLGTFIILNDEGWIMTAAHNLDVFFAFDQHRKEMMDYQQEIDKIKSNIQLKESEKKLLFKSIYNTPHLLDQKVSDAKLIFFAVLCSILV